MNKSLESLRQEIIDALAENIIMVEFVKVDGTRRTIRGTLKPSMLPAPKELKEGEVKKERKVNTEVITIYDLDSQSWKSFRVENYLNHWLADSEMCEGK